MATTGPSRQELLDSIRANFPEMKWEEARFFDNGWDHAVVVLDDVWVFRTPKNSEYRDEFANEIKLLAYLRPKLSVGMPKYELVSPDSLLAGYRIVAGTELTRALFGGLTASERESAAGQLAGFLTVLHATPKKITRECQVRTESQEEAYASLVEQVRTLLVPRLTSGETGLADALLADLQSSLDDPYSDVLIHCDLTHEHILWDADNQQINIIDFSDRAMGDPAMDFAGLFEYGNEFTQKVFSLYGGEKDERTLQRAKLYFMRIPVSIMVDSLLGYPCTFEDGYQRFRKLFC